MIITSSNGPFGGTLEGQGSAWWGFPGIGYLEREENRPRMLNIENSHDVLVENLAFKQPPYWTFWAHGIQNLEVRWSSIDARRLDNHYNSHDIIELTAFNTDGFDVSGSNIWIHDSWVWNQDDSFCIKDDSQNVLIERVNASGIGLTIGSISSHVRNVTFRNANMLRTNKGIYMKFRGPGLIEDVLYENINIVEPESWPIWIGPAQQSDSKNVCAAHPCSLCWPWLPLSAWAKCNPVQNALYRNITLRNVTIDKPKMVPGVILGDEETSAMQDVVFDNVIVTNPSRKTEKWGSGYLCKGVRNGTALGHTWPVPSCFEDRTNKTTITSSVRRPGEQQVVV
eukprot:TRINITY_DN13242_c0_g1_i3.p1 TRINITY_DN13242_c0_g1~~TRINITY_DN13242_c0_g1_i3.p1  ORF type:complete len:339 (-),score=35.62 TRINITY_DN13242_c0_g1_i3:135-1151(-)